MNQEEGKQLVQLLKREGYNESNIPKQKILARLFYQSQKISDNLPSELKTTLENKRILVNQNGEIYSKIRIVPYRGKYFIVDSPFIASTGGTNHYHSNNAGVYGFIGNDGMMLSDYVLSQISGRRFKMGLDLCTGSGIIGMSISDFCDNVYGVDIDESALNWAKFNTRLNDVNNYEPSLGNLYSGVNNIDPFDIIVSNPSYSFFSPEFMKKYRLRAHEVAGDYGLELIFKIIDGFETHLEPNGEAYLCTLTPIVNGRDYMEEQIKFRYSKLNYAFEIVYNNSYIQRECETYYKSLGIGQIYFVCVKVQKGQSFSVRKVYTKAYYLSRLPLVNYVPNTLKQFLRRKLVGR